MKKTMVAEKIIALLLTSSLLIMFAACDQVENPPEETDTLVVYADRYNYDFLERSLSYFALENPNIDIDLRQFEYSDNWQEEYNTTLTRELSAGAGPDLILFAENIGFSDFHKTVASGAFENLNSFFEKDDSFDFSDYNKTVMDFGVYNENRYFVPISYQVNTIMTSQEALNNNSIVKTIPTSMQELFLQMNDYCTFYRDDETKSFTNYYNGYSFLSLLNQPIADSRTKTVNVKDNDEFDELIDAMKAEYMMMQNKGEAFDAYYIENAALHINDNLQYILNTDAAYGFFSNYGTVLSDQTPVYTALPSDGAIASLSTAAAINRNGKNKANAYKLLKWMLSDEMQKYVYKEYLTIPVKSDLVYDLCREACLQYSSWSYYETDKKIALIPDEQIKEIVEEFTNISKVSHTPTTVYQFVISEMTPYFDNQKSYEECLKSLENKLELYINE